MKRYDSLISDASLWLLRLHTSRPKVLRQVWVLILFPRTPARDARTLICLLTPRNLLEFYQNSDGKTKKRILSCIFSEKIHFDENRDAAISYSTPISILLNASKVLGGLKKEKEVKNDLLSTFAP